MWPKPGWYLVSGDMWATVQALKIDTFIAERKQFTRYTATGWGSPGQATRFQTEAEANAAYESVSRYTPCIVREIVDHAASEWCSTCDRPADDCGCEESGKENRRSSE
jgi:hypothetical protein